VNGVCRLRQQKHSPSLGKVHEALVGEVLPFLEWYSVLKEVFMRSSILVLVLLSALVVSVGQAMRYEPREPDPKPYQFPCDVISYWLLLDSMWINADDSQPVRKESTTRLRRGEYWLTVCDVNCELENFEQPHPRNRYLVNDERHSDASSEPFVRRGGRWLLWTTLLDDWNGRCGDLNGATARLN
jgi:hypothetical protein